MKTYKNFDRKNDFYNLQTNNYDDLTCNLKFLQCDENKYSMDKLSKSEIKKFITFAKKLENLKWQEIKSYSGLKYELLKNYDGPDYLSKDISLSSLRVDKKFRIIGYRDKQDYYIIWFDNNHETC